MKQIILLLLLTSCCPQHQITLMRTNCIAQRQHIDILTNQVKGGDEYWVIKGLNEYGELILQNPMLDRDYFFIRANDYHYINIVCPKHDEKELTK